MTAGAVPVAPAATLRALSPRAEHTRTAMERVATLLRQSPELAPLGVYRPHPLLVLAKRRTLGVLCAPACVWASGRQLLEPYARRLADGELRLLVIGQPASTSQRELTRALELGVSACLSAEPSREELVIGAFRAFELLAERAGAAEHVESLERYRYELSELIEIARAITTERDLDRLLGLILEKSRFVSGADAGSLYVVEGATGEPAARQLRFKLTQNDSVSFDATEFTMPISPRSLAGYVALEKKTIRIDDVYEMPPEAPFGFDRSFDDKVGYRTKSVLCTPLVSSQGEVVGVLQLINKKRDRTQRLRSAADVERWVSPFDDRSEELLTTLSAQAGISLENAILYEEIRTIFEGFVRASVDAIEARDPTTSGHSRRVADLTVCLARAIEHTSTGPYASVRWTREDLDEIQYASLLHDFGKIGVREHVLVKANKLYPHTLELIRQRFEFVIRSLEAEFLAQQLDAVHSGAPARHVAELEASYRARRKRIETAFAIVEHANQPSVLAAGDFQVIEELGRESYLRLGGGAAPLLTADEVQALSVMRGSLTPEEYDEIRSHVSHTFRFLSTIPWGKTFARVPLIAGAHHERLNGTGYPHGLAASEIPLQSKLMAVSDIFDALTASDRPYKRAVPLDKALAILDLEVKDEHVDGELVRIFKEARVWALAERAPRSRGAVSV